MRIIMIAGTSFSLALASTSAAAQRAGQLIAAQPVVETPAGMQAWRVRYWTNDGAGRPREATGMVVAPREAIPSAAATGDCLDPRHLGRRQQMRTVAERQFLDSDPRARCGEKRPCGGRARLSGAWKRGDASVSGRASIPAGRWSMPFAPRGKSPAPRSVAVSRFGAIRREDTPRCGRRRLRALMPLTWSWSGPPRRLRRPTCSKICG